MTFDNENTLGTMSPAILKQKRFGTLARLALLGVIACCAFLGSAQDGQIIKEIEVQYVGSKTVAEERILSRMSTKVGQTLSLAQVDEDVKGLYESGEVDNVRILSEPAPGGVKLIVVVQSRSLFGGVEFEGNELFSDAKLAKTLELSANKAIDEAALRKARQDIQNKYREKGYSEAAVSYRIAAPTPQGYSKVVFNIDEGSQGILRDVKFEGNNAIAGAKLKEVMAQREKSIVSTVTKKVGRTDAESMAQDVRAIEDHYRDSGYLNARVTNVSKIPVDSKYNDVQITINEGQQFNVGEISLEGVKALSQEQDIAPQLKTKAGQAFSGSALRDDIKLINDKYGTEGFVEARVNPRLEDGGPGRVNVRLQVDEGRPYKIGQIHIEGNERTYDRVIRRELPLYPGEALDMNVVDVATRRLQNMNYFETVDITPVNTSYCDQKDLIVKVTEKSTGSLNLGAGFSTIDNVTGFAEVTQSNFDLFGWRNGFVGGGQRFRLNVRGGAMRKDVSVSITEPWFMGNRVALTTEGFYRDANFLSTLFDQKTYGGSIGLRKALAEFLYASLDYRYEVYEIDPAATAPAIYQAEAGTHIKNSLALDATYDTRDNLFLPRRGHRVQAGVEGAGLGGNVDDMIYSASASQHYTVPGTDLILNAVGRFNYSAQGDHLFTRHFLGGANNLRGFNFRDVGPKDPVQFQGVGGRQAWFASVEATYPVVDKVRVAAFYDVGEVSGGPVGSVGGGLNSDYGAGLRLFLMGPAPIRLDYAIPVQTDPFNQNNGRFNFTIGTQF